MTWQCDWGPWCLPVLPLLLSFCSAVPSASRRRPQRAPHTPPVKQCTHSPHSHFASTVIIGNGVDAHLLSPQHPGLCAHRLQLLWQLLLLSGQSLCSTGVLPTPLDSWAAPGHGTWAGVRLDHLEVLLKVERPFLPHLVKPHPPTEQTHSYSSPAFRPWGPFMFGFTIS